MNKNPCTWLPAEYEKLRWELYTQKFNKMKQNKTVEVTEKWINTLVEQAQLTNDLLITIIDDDRVPLSSREVGIISRFIGHAMSAELLLPKQDKNVF